MGVVSKDQALFLAYEKEIDLVELNGKIDPPICKLMDYGKFLYEKSKQVQKQRSQQKAAEVKEIKLSINIGEHDLKVKENQAERFLNDGNKVKLFLVLRGREMMFRDKAFVIINKFKEDVNAEFEQSANSQGNRFMALLRKK